ncbi:uncharacterized protein LOC105845801 isoform X2 [Hydra vulgaris]|uniref:Uncharacterized protein LOC105845801 isoform X2 n=1 Tax=Hydra vulgaris TaxID=6087 RepID=A0ABM4C617_HYDVU
MCSYIFCIAAEVSAFLLLLMGVLLLIFCDGNSSYFIAGQYVSGAFGLFCFSSLLFIIIIACTGNCGVFAGIVKTGVSSEWRQLRSQNISRVQLNSQIGITQPVTISVLPGSRNNISNENSLENEISTDFSCPENNRPGINILRDPPSYGESFINIVENISLPTYEETA